MQPINATSRILADERIIGMRNRLGSAIENVARIWGGDVEVVQVRAAPVLPPDPFSSKN